MSLNLLTHSNQKTLKGEAHGFMTFILHLAPHKSSGYNTCPMASKGCAAGCLNTAGRGVYQNVQEARIRKTKLFFENRAGFMAMLVEDIKTALRMASRKRLEAVFRLNGTSDIRWENFALIRDGQKFPNVMLAFPGLQFYDYTKLHNRKNIPHNYHLTFSLNEKNQAKAEVALQNGMNVAVVFRTEKHPKEYLAHRVVSGDLTDLRFLDARKVVVALKAKGRAKRDTSGFVKEVA